MDLSRITLITFDCYGTLMDWERGIIGAVRAALPGLTWSEDEILMRYSELEPKVQQGAYQRYRVVLREVLAGLALAAGRTPTDPEALADSLKSWRPFPDTVPALTRLKEKYRLGIISNIDDDLFAMTAPQLRVAFDHVITAQQVGSYKPARRNFQVALERTRVPKDQLLHVAESLYHDIAPAAELGIANVWVDRRRGKGAAASAMANVKPDATVPDLAALANLLLRP